MRIYKSKFPNLTVEYFRRLESHQSLKELMRLLALISDRTLTSGSLPASTIFDLMKEIVIFSISCFREELKTIERNNPGIKPEVLINKEPWRIETGNLIKYYPGERQKIIQNEKFSDFFYDLYETLSLAEKAFQKGNDPPQMFEIKFKQTSVLRQTKKIRSNTKQVQKLNSQIGFLKRKLREANRRKIRRSQNKRKS